MKWTAWRSSQSILKEINPEYSLKGWMLKLKFQYSGHLIWRADTLEKTLILGNTEGRSRSRQQRMSYLDGIIDLIDMSLRKLWETRKAREAWCAEVIQSDMTERLNNNKLNDFRKWDSYGGSINVIYKFSSICNPVHSC